MSNKTLYTLTDYLPPSGLWLWEIPTGKLRRKIPAKDTGNMFRSGGDGPRVLMAAAPDGKTFVTADRSHVLRLWDTTTGKLLGVLGKPDQLGKLAFAPDGRTLVTTGYGKEGGTIKFWDTTVTTDRFELPVSTSPITDMVSAPDGQTLATAATDGKITLWNATDWTRCGLLQGPAVSLSTELEFDTHHYKYLALAFAPDGKSLAAVSNKGLVSTFDLKTRKLRTPFGGWRRESHLEDLIYDGRYLVCQQEQAGGHWPTIWDVTKRQECAQVSMNWNGIITVAPGGKMLADVGGIEDKGRTHEIKLWDLVTAQARVLYRWPKDSYSGDIWKAVFSPNGKFLAFMGPRIDIRGKAPNVVEVSGVKILKVAAGKEHATLVLPLDAAQQQPALLAFSPPDGRTLVTAFNDRFGRPPSIQLWDVPTGKLRNTLPVHGDPRDLVWHVAFAPDGKTLATVVGPTSTGGHFWRDATTGQLKHHMNSWSVYLWDASTGKKKTSFLISYRLIDSLVFLPDGKTLAARSGERVRIWDVKTGTKGATLGDHGTYFAAAGFAPDGQLRAATLQKCMLHPAYRARVWDLAAKWEVTRLREIPEGSKKSNDPWLPGWTLDGKSLTVAKAAKKVFSPNRRTLAEANRAEVKLTNPATGQTRFRLKGQDPVTCLTFAPDGKTLATGSVNGSIRLWNVAAGRLLLSLRGHEGVVSSVAFRADGRLLASCDGTDVRLWRAATDEELAAQVPPKP
jgi:WD40 repeat protein